MSSASGSVLSHLGLPAPDHELSMPCEPVAMAITKRLGYSTRKLPSRTSYATAHADRCKHVIAIMIVAKHRDQPHTGLPCDNAVPSTDAGCLQEIKWRLYDYVYKAGESVAYVKGMANNKVRPT
jgi:hypothetical protein